MIIGIDPGITGGISVIVDKNIDFYDMPINEDLWEFFQSLKTNAVIEGYEIVAYIENISYMPKWAAKTIWILSGNLHALKIAIQAAKIPMVSVKPKTWQQKLEVFYPPKSTDTKKKNIGKAKAIQLFPHKEVKKSLADSMLIAYYGKLQEK